ncbi:MAG: Wzz/FepE/Etk N-terminal domain-containing protein [Ignavibacteria bacterium]|nr:Wzz/FepE/Etk N-terminal domain-containing protein [Ignavibacteria bacterium]
MQEAANIQKEKSFETLIIAIVKSKRFIITNTVIVTLAAIVIALMMDNWYTSTTSIVPSKKRNSLLGDIGASLPGRIQDLSKTLGRLGGPSDESMSYLMILQSRRALEAVAQKFDIRNVYHISPKKPIEDVLSELNDNVKFSVEDEGNLTIKVTDKDPVRAAQMANYFVDQLNIISSELGTREASSNKNFLEKRCNDVKKELAAAEDSLRAFNHKYHILSIDEQTKAGIKEAAELKSELTLQQIQLEVLKKMQGDNSMIIRSAEIKIEELEKRLTALKYGSNWGSGDNLTQLVPAFENVPDIAIKSIRLIREVEFKNRLFAYLMPVYEQTKIDEQKDMPICLVLDKAVPAQKKSSPHRSIIIGLASLLTFFFSVTISLIKHSYQEFKTDEARYNHYKEGVIEPLKSLFFIGNRK